MTTLIGKSYMKLILLIGLTLSWVSNSLAATEAEEAVFTDIPKYKVIGEGGKTTLRFGESIPDVVCAPLRLCVVALEVGEIVNSVHVGDKERWIVTPTFTGTEEFGRTHVVIKPEAANLTTSLVLATQKRSYVFNLISHNENYMPFLQFSYPVHQDQAWGSFISQQRAFEKKRVEKEKVVKKKNNTKTILHLVTDYKIEGVAPWKPEAIYHDGLHTYIRFPKTTRGGELPVLLVMSAESTDEKDLIQVNYRVINDVMKIDYVVERGILVAGVDDSQHRVMFSLGGREE